jgi:hypothetical protein
MKLLFHKTEYYGHWFDDKEKPEGFTEKVPPDTGYVFDEDLNDWVPKPIPEPVPEEPVEEPEQDSEPETEPE